MRELVLITGGAGFIGSHTADLLLSSGYAVRILDSLNPQIHPSGHLPAYLPAGAEIRRGDVRDLESVKAALDGVSYVFHMASETGVGQSMYEAGRYVDTNVTGTAVLWDAIGTTPPGAIRKVILPSSRAVYGEGRYVCRRDGIVYPAGREADRLRQGDWAMRCPVCGQPVDDTATPEDSRRQPVSVYGLTKKVQEDLCRLMGGVRGVPVIALRYFNVYGPRQAPTNPYTGVIVTFLTRLLNDSPIVLYEEGLPRRDFVHVHDVARANLAALRSETDVPFQVFNVGAGTPLTLREIAAQMCAALGLPDHIEVTDRHRIGDILACYADLSRTTRDLGYRPQVAFADGIRDLRDWIDHKAIPDHSEAAAAELRQRGLLIGG